MSRTKSVRKPWSKEEDSALLKLIAKHGAEGCWPQIAVMMFNRTGKQCRERYINHLDPDIKRTPWSMQEDNVIRDMFPFIGTKWSQYIEHLPGRSDNAIKNRYHVISRYGMAPRGHSVSGDDTVASSKAGTKRSISVATSSETDDPDGDKYVAACGDPQQHRLKRLQTARQILDQRIRELEDSGSHLSGASSPSDISSTFCEEAIMHELGSEFEDFDFLWSGSEQVLPQKIESRQNLCMGFDFDCYEVAVKEEEKDT